MVADRCDAIAIHTVMHAGGRPGWGGVFRFFAGIELTAVASAAPMLVAVKAATSPSCNAPHLRCGG
jgi:hypothetical protein